MTRVSIIGSGSMAQAVSGVLTRGGAEVAIVGRDGTLDPSTEVVVLAGTIVVDITNPIDFAAFDSLAVRADSSAAALIAEALPKLHVFKAFHTTFAATLATGTIGGDLPTTVLIAGDDTTAKDTLAGLVEAGGFAVVA